MNPATDAGRPVSEVDGSEGTFTVVASTKQFPDLRARGRLEYVGKRYLRFAGDRSWYLKGGCGSPETLLGYVDFDGTFRETVDRGATERGIPPAPNPLIPLPALKDGLHRYASHAKDWKSGDSSWQAGKGKGLIGGLNYLASRGVNSLYFLTMNVNGDGRNVWPWVDPWSFERFDCSKLAQWEIVFQHMTQVGIVPHFVLQETENDHLLDFGDAGVARRLYYRELVARFAHHPALLWNLGEENVQSPRQQKRCGAVLRELDPYDHPIVLHNDSWHAKNLQDTFEPLLADPSICGASIQDFYVHDIPANVQQLVLASEQAERPWVVFADELDGDQRGAMPDSEDPSRDDLRRVLWETLLAGGAGVEWYFGWQNNGPHSDLSAEDWRTRDQLYRQTAIAREFFQRELPFFEMLPADDLVVGKGVSCLALPGETYAIYLPAGRGTRLRLPAGPGVYRVQWFDPRSGGESIDGPVSTIRGPGLSWTGPPPSHETQDWVVLVTRSDETAPSMQFPDQTWAVGRPIELGVDPAGLNHALNAWRQRLNEDGHDRTVVSRRGVVIYQGPDAHQRGNLYSSTKTVTSLILGLLVGEGRLSLDSRAATYEPLLGEHYPDVRLRHFATMTSGYNAVGDSRWDEPSTDWSSTPYDPAPPLFAPGEEFAYWDEAQMMFGRVLTQAAEEDLLQILGEAVLDPLGIQDVRWDAEGEINGLPIRNGCTGLHLNSLEMARLGLLMLNDGIWKGQQVLPAGWMELATTTQVSNDTPLAATDRASLDGRGCYGFNLWLNGDANAMPDAPQQAFYTAGLHHNICLVVPEWEMVVVRLGNDRSPAGGHAATLNHFFRRLAPAVYPLADSDASELPATGNDSRPAKTSASTRSPIQTNSRMKVEPQALTGANYEQ